MGVKTELLKQALRLSAHTLVEVRARLERRR
jgi:hypothetical protein